MAGAGPQPHSTTPKRKRSALEGGGVQKKAPSASAMASPPLAPAGLTVADVEALDCGVCFLPLRPPIFQCDVGHVLCSACSEKLKGAGKCHVCGVSTTAAGGYRRCHAMERVVDGIRTACPNAPYGCAATPPYHGREEHLLSCPHAPCHCPGEACGFAGSTDGLLEHFRAAHGWPCVADVKADDYGMFTVFLRDGFNLVAADCSPAVRCLLLLNVVRQPLGRTISVVCIDPHAGGGEGLAASKKMECRLSYSCYRFVNDHRGGYQTPLDHYQASTFRVAQTDLSNGMPKPDGCFHFVLDNSVIADLDKDGIEITAPSPLRTH